MLFQGSDRLPKTQLSKRKERMYAKTADSAWSEFSAFETKIRSLAFESFALRGRETKRNLVCFAVTFPYMYKCPGISAAWSIRWKGFLLLVLLLNLGNNRKTFQITQRKSLAAKAQSFTVKGGPLQQGPRLKDFLSLKRKEVLSYKFLFQKQKIPPRHRYRFK